MKTKVMTRHDCRHRSSCLDEVIADAGRNWLPVMDCTGCVSYQQDRLHLRDEAAVEQVGRLLSLSYVILYEHEKGIIRRSRRKACLVCGDEVPFQRIAYCSAECYKQGRTARDVARQKKRRERQRREQREEQRRLQRLTLERLADTWEP